MCSWLPRRLQNLVRSISIGRLHEFGICNRNEGWADVGGGTITASTVLAICNATGNNWICIKHRHSHWHRHRRMTIAISQFLHALVSFIDSTAASLHATCHAAALEPVVLNPSPFPNPINSFGQPKEETEYTDAQPGKDFQLPFGCLMVS